MNAVSRTTGAESSKVAAEPSLFLKIRPPHLSSLKAPLPRSRLLSASVMQSRVLTSALSLSLQERVRHPVFMESILPPLFLSKV